MRRRCEATIQTCTLSHTGRQIFLYLAIHDFLFGDRPIFLNQNPTRFQIAMVCCLVGARPNGEGHGVRLPRDHFELVVLVHHPRPVVRRPCPAAVAHGSRVPGQSRPRIGLAAHGGGLGSRDGGGGPLVGPEGVLRGVARLGPEAGEDALQGRAQQRDARVGEEQRGLDGGPEVGGEELVARVAVVELVYLNGAGDAERTDTDKTTTRLARGVFFFFTHTVSTLTTKEERFQIPFSKTQ